MHVIAVFLGANGVKNLADTEDSDDICHEVALMLANGRFWRNRASTDEYFPHETFSYSYVCLRFALRRYASWRVRRVSVHGRLA